MVKASSSWTNTLVTRLVNILAKEKEAILYNNDWMKRKYKFHVVSDLISFMNEGLLADYDQKKLAFKWIWTMAINCCFKSSYKNKDNFLKSFIWNYKLLR